MTHGQQRTVLRADSPALAAVMVPFMSREGDGREKGGRRVSGT